MLKKLFTPKRILILLGGLIGASLVLYAWRLPPFTSSVEMTDNAYIRGYVTMMSPQVSGYVVEVPVKDYQAVSEGDLLARIDDRIYTQKLAQAEATLATQKAGLDNSHQQETAAKAKITSSKAAVDAAQADLEQAQLQSDRQDALIKSGVGTTSRSEEHTSELQSLMRHSYSVFCLKKKKTINHHGIQCANSHNKLKTEDLMKTNYT